MLRRPARRNRLRWGDDRVGIDAVVAAEIGDRAGLAKASGACLAAMSSLSRTGEKEPRVASLTLAITRAVHGCSGTRMMKLYYAPGACSLAPHIVLEETGARFELARVDLAANQQNSPEFLRLNPNARVPVLVDGNWVLTESPAILRYVTARHPASGLWPWDPREEARCAEWLNWLSATIQVAFTHVRRAARYASDLRAVEDVATTGKKTCGELWRAVEKKLGPGPWALGSRYSVADPLLLVYWTWGRGPVLGFDMTHDFPQWTEHARRLARRPAVQRAFATEGLQLPD
jgi:glutathione S-transferase